MKQLKIFWERSTTDTTVTKFEQDVLENLKKLPLKYRDNSNDPETGLECDLIVNEYKGKPVKIAVEVNGVFHYSRNSEEPLGKDVLKRRTLEKYGYKVLVVPYFHWYILEDSQKAAFLKDVIESTLL